jgi:hypothetical protein
MEKVLFMNYNNVGTTDKNKIVDMPLFIIPTSTRGNNKQWHIYNFVFIHNTYLIIIHK